MPSAQCSVSHGHCPPSISTPLVWLFVFSRQTTILDHATSVHAFIRTQTILPRHFALETAYSPCHLNVRASHCYRRPQAPASRRHRSEHDPLICIPLARSQLSIAQIDLLQTSTFTPRGIYIQLRATQGAMEPHSRPCSSQNGTLRFPQALILLLRTCLANPTSHPLTLIDPVLAPSHIIRDSFNRLIWFFNPFVVSQDLKNSTFVGMVKLTALCGIGSALWLCNKRNSQRARPSSSRDSSSAHVAGKKPRMICVICVLDIFDPPSWMRHYFQELDANHLQMMLPLLILASSENTLLFVPTRYHLVNSHTRLSGPFIGLTPRKASSPRSPALSHFWSSSMA